MSLRDLIQDGAAIDAVASYLDGLSHAERLAETRSLDRGEQRRLYRAAERSPLITLDHFAPPATPVRTQVRHFGRNTLPLPAPLKLFEKRFAKPVEKGVGRLFGYNQSPFLGTVGPGFYVAVPTSGSAGNPEWEARGGVVVDYFQCPDGPVPVGWPEVIPNTKGLQRFVYHRTRDFMRKVSDHVSIGAAYKVEKALDHYFILCRES